MIKLSATLILAFGCAVFSSSSSLADSHPVTFDKTGTAVIKCACILATSACVSKLGDAAAGSERNTWTSIAHAIAGHTADLSDHCWRRRNVNSEGAGLCCSLHNDESDIRFFWGDLDVIQ